MKRIILILLLVGTQLTTIKASHTSSGEIGWECLDNGKYVFKMNLFIQCLGTPISFTNKTLSVFGSPLPRDSMNQVLSSILLKPDSVRWINENYGLPSNECNPQPASMSNCSNYPSGTLRSYFFKSDPIELNGIPASRFGWFFTYQMICCKPSYENINASGGTILRAKMYPTNVGDSINHCFDSSPEFIESPKSII